MASAAPPETAASSPHSFPVLIISSSSSVKQNQTRTNGFAAESPSGSTSNSSKHLKLMWLGLIVGIAVAILLVVVVVLTVAFRKRRTVRGLHRKKGSLKGEKLNLKRFEMEELEMATDHFSDERLLGSGAFGNVYKGFFEDEGITLAVKRAHANSFHSDGEFINGKELPSILLALMFDELIRPRGAKILVYEYAPNGSLLEYIIGRGGKQLTWQQRVSIAIGAAKGIAHLHDGIQPSIIHRDIKPSNILVGENFEAKVSDFGLVKSGPTGDQSHVSTQIKGTLGYLDPAYCSSCHLSQFSDVYSFGVILLQLVTARPAVDASRRNSNYNVINWSRASLERGDVEEILDANLMGQPCNTDMMLKMGQLGLRCVVKNPKDRPTMSRVWQELQEALFETTRVAPGGSLTMSNQSTSQEWQDQQEASSGATRVARRGSLTTSEGKLTESCGSIASVNEVGFERFSVNMDSSFDENTSLRFFEDTSIDIDLLRNNLDGTVDDHR
ncbi:Probable receptor-like protein kinase At5g59700 [Linum perenne]